MNYKELAEKYYKFHNEPLLKIELPPSKFFLESPNDHKEKIEHYQDSLKKSLEYVRVERRCARSKGIWRENLGLCEVTKVVGNILKNFGFQDKNGIYLLPEETLFLVEQNKLELTNNSEQVSIYEAYTLVMNHVTLKKYRVYKTLVEQGYKLLNKEAIRKFYSKQTRNNQNNTRKRKCTDSETENEIKKMKTELGQEDTIEYGESTKIEHEAEYFTNIFEKLVKQSPKLILPSESSRCPDYFGFLPNPESKEKHDFNLYIREETDLKDFDNYESGKNIFAICTNDNVTFDRYPNINIPTIS